MIGFGSLTLACGFGQAAAGCKPVGRTKRVAKSYLTGWIVYIISVKC